MLHVRVLSTCDELSTFRPEWERTCAEAANASPYLCSDCIIAERREQEAADAPKGQGGEPWVCVVRDPDRWWHQRPAWAYA